jgi:trimethyllysine dioxygenase
MVRQFRYNTYDFAPLSYMDESGVSAFYHHNRVMCSLMRSNEFMTKVKLQEGEMVVIDNHRVCHGRTAFTGYRNLVGCYIGRDDWESKLRVHGARLPEDL